MSSMRKKNRDEEDVDKRIDLSRLRQQALREATSKGERLLNNPYHYKLIFNTIFISLLCTPIENEKELAVEFWNVIRHLLEGKPITELPTKHLDKDVLINKINKIIRGESVNIDEEDDNG